MKNKDGSFDILVYPFPMVKGRDYMEAGTEEGGWLDTMNKTRIANNTPSQRFVDAWYEGDLEMGQG